VTGPSTGLTRLSFRHAVTGVLGVLLKAKRLGHIPTVKPQIQALKTKARFFVSASLEAQILASAGE
jgi:predicted nucleic acid-binding protein